MIYKYFLNLGKKIFRLVRKWPWEGQREAGEIASSASSNSFDLLTEEGREGSVVHMDPAVLGINFLWLETAAGGKGMRKICDPSIHGSLDPAHNKKLVRTD